MRRAQRYLDQHDVAYAFVDIDEDAEARAYCDEVHSGSWIVPTIAFPDGDILCNPSLKELTAKVESKS